jgi:hypothetical protein
MMSMRGADFITDIHTGLLIFGGAGRWSAGTGFDDGSSA